MEGRNVFTGACDSVYRGEGVCLGILVMWRMCEKLLSPGASKTNSDRANGIAVFLLITTRAPIEFSLPTKSNGRSKSSGRISKKIISDNPSVKPMSVEGSNTGTSTEKQFLKFWVIYGSNFNPMITFVEQ